MLPIYILKIILIKSIKYLLVLIYIIEKDRVIDNKYQSIKTSRNKMVKILVK